MFSFARLVLAVQTLAFVSVVQAARLVDDPNYSYVVRFTNPECQLYKYPTPVRSRGGDLLTAKPQNVFCKSGDAELSGEDPTSPQAEVIERLRQAQNKEVFLSFLSFSNRPVFEELCRGAQEGRLKVTFVMDQEQESTLSNELQNCGEGDYKAQVLYRGHVTGIEWAHTKLILIKSLSVEAPVHVIFGSGNMTSGAVLHHENWHFVTASASSYFVQLHLCLRDGLIDHAESGRGFSSFLRSCKSRIASEEETDIKVSLVPGEGKRAFQFMDTAIQSAKAIDIAAHRFSYNLLMQSLTQKLQSEPNVPVRLIADDDLFWVGAQRGFRAPNTLHEYKIVEGLKGKGLQVKYMQTNHWSNLLHHNKFMIFSNNEGPYAVHTGAGNFTGSAFAGNLENYYFITIPEVVRSFQEQYAKMWTSMASWERDLPQDNAKPE